MNVVLKEKSKMVYILTAHPFQTSDSFVAQAYPIMASLDKSKVDEEYDILMKELDNVNNIEFYSVRSIELD